MSVDKTASIYLTMLRMVSARRPSSLCPQTSTTEPWSAVVMMKAALINTGRTI